MEPTVPRTPGLQLVDPAPMPPNATPPGVWTTAVQLKSWTLIEAAADAFTETQEAITDYLNRFSSWLTQYQDGVVYGPSGLQGDPNAIPPAPPKVRQAQLNLFGTAWDLVESDTPACNVPAYTKIPMPQSVTGGNALVDFQKELGATITTGAASPFTNSAALGAQLTAPDGSKWVRIG